VNALFEDTADDYLKLIGDWKDPWPEPVIQEHDGYLVVRDDLLNAGSKVRFLDYLIGSKPEINEWVFGSCPATGYAQISSLLHVGDMQRKQCCSWPNET